MTGTTVTDLTPSAPLQKCTDAFRRFQLSDDLVCRFGPDERPGMVVVLGEVTVNGGLQVDD
jgi:hypothetical protein